MTGVSPSVKIHGRIKFSILCSRFQNTAMEGISSPNSLTYVDEDHVRPSKMPKLKTIPEKKGVTIRSHAKTSALLNTVKSKLVTKAKMSEAAKATLSKSSSRSSSDSSDSSFKSLSQPALPQTQTQDPPLPALAAPRKLSVFPTRRSVPVDLA